MMTKAGGMMHPEHGTASYIRTLEGWRGDARLFKVDPPLGAAAYVVVSAVIVPFSGPETFIFAADAEGEVTSFSELPGSFSGALDHARALRDAGYTLELEHVS